MKLTRTLLADLERQYHYDNQPLRQPTLLGVILKSFSPRFMPVVLFRLSSAAYRNKLRSLAKLIAVVNQVVFGCEIAMRCDIGEGLYLPHTVGTVIGALRIGRNAVIYQGVTLGAKEVNVAYDDDCRPTVGDDVVVGSGAKVLGGISIGDGSVIGANAVVVDDVPAHSVVGGIPAKVLRVKNEEKQG